MADLDDFFAKKDKKKSKAKPKFLTAEELVKNLEDTSKKEAVIKPKKTESTTAVPTTVAEGEENKIIEEQPPLEEEWNDFVEEERKDYTGLKIGHLTLNDDEEDSQSELEEYDADSDGNINIISSKRSDGPWKKVIPAEEVTQIPMEIEKPSSKYVSPGLRHITGPKVVGARIKSRTRVAPDITNADFFPTLGAARPEEQRKKKNEPAFEEVRHGGRVQRIQEQQIATPSNATNRFQSLDEEDS